MNQQQRALRVGITAILCAAVLRLFSGGMPEKLFHILQKETGQSVRFSPSLEAFSPDFMESPPAATTAPTEPPIPSFSDAEAIAMTWFSKKNPDIQALLEAPLTWDLTGEGPTVLILHTHSTESYTKQGEDYEETSAWRTLDEDYNMLSIGACLAERLEDLGISAIQDREFHDYPSYNGSYTHARASIRAYQEEYPGLLLILDLHRDASEASGRQMRPVVSTPEGDCAQVMLVVGANHEGYEENLSLALKLHAQLESQVPGITRPLQLRASRFNQDLCPGALLIEVGAAGNSHSEALAAAEELAKAISALARGTA